MSIELKPVRVVVNQERFVWKPRHTYLDQLTTDLALLREVPKIIWVPKKYETEFNNAADIPVYITGTYQDVQIKILDEEPVRDWTEDEDYGGETPHV